MIAFPPLVTAALRFRQADWNAATPLEHLNEQALPPRDKWRNRASVLPFCGTWNYSVSACHRYRIGLFQDVFANACRAAIYCHFAFCATGSTRASGVWALHLSNTFLTCVSITSILPVSITFPHVLAFYYPPLYQIPHGEQFLFIQGKCRPFFCDTVIHATSYLFSLPLSAPFSRNLYRGLMRSRCVLHRY